MQVGNWIHVSERRPLNGERVLVDNLGYPQIVTYLSTPQVHRYLFDEHVTYWASIRLPEKP